jgi:O-antigen/teichoic acid export membrane protein
VLGSIVASTPVILLLVSSLIIFCGKYRYLRPSLQYYDYSLVKDILRLGVVFFIIQFITIILYQSNNLIITHVIGNEGVVEYNIAHKYFQVLYTLYMIVVTPMWSATTQAYVLKDLQWIDKTQKNLNKVAMLFSGIGVIMLALSPVIYKLWLGDGNIHIAFTTSLLLFASEAFRMFYGNYGYIINGIGKLNAQLIITGAMTLIYLPVTLLLGKHWGLVGVLVMNALVNIVNFIWSKYQYKLILENKAKGFWNK